MRIIAIVICLLSGIWLYSQEVYLSFDNCLADNTGVLADPEISGQVGCDCGVFGESIALSENNSALTFDSTYTSFFQENFTMSFYFMVRDDAVGVNDIFSVSSSCRVDSSITIKYLAPESTVRVQIARDFELFVEMDARINKDHCWHQLVLVRDNDNYRLYIDGAFADNGFTNGQITIDSSAEMRFANSPCQLAGETPFLGKIDEFKIYSRPLSVEEIFDDFVELDDILTRDTTIFSGTSLTIKQAASCSELITWFPSTNVSDPLILEPVISPDETSLYRVNYDYGICRAQDSITIAIIDSEAVVCNNILIPNAFTPNNDGLNDEIGISNAFIIEELKDFEIFDRWGEKVFATSIKTEQWDGSLQDKKVNSNVFLYKVSYTCKGEEFIKTGSFSILR